MNLDDNRLVKAFAELRSAGKKTLVPFITAGYPDLKTTEALLREFAGRGVRVCELGIPFSDPIADGPVIQASYTEALAGGITSEKIFEMVRSYRRGRGRAGSNWQSAMAGPSPFGIGNGQLALVAMVSYTIVFRHDAERYLADAVGAGFDGLVIPDLPLEEAGELEPLAAAKGLCNVMLIAPTTSPERRAEIARHSRGFLYCISVAGITGERRQLPQATIEAVAELRNHTDTPICVGFGISNAAMVKTVCQVADGAIVGSAIVHRIRDAVTRKTPRGKLIKQIGDFVEDLLVPLR